MRSLLLASLVFGACTEGTDVEWGGTVTDSAGVAIVANPSEGIWSEGEAWTLVEEMRVGTMAGDPNLQFGQIGARGIELLSDGRILVLDAMGQHVKVFSEDGEFLDSFGGPGSGPGEIGAGSSFLIAARGDTVFLPDLQNQRVNLYDGDGASLGSFPMELSSGIPFLWDRTAAGRVVAQMRQLALPNLPEPDGTDWIVEFSNLGEVTDSLLGFESGGTLSFASDRPEIKFFAPEPSWDLTDTGRILHGVSDDYRIQVYAADGRLDRIVTKPFTSPPVLEGDHRIIMDFMEGAWADAGVPPEAIIQLRSVVEFAESYPAFARVQGGLDGSIWVQRVQPLSELPEEALEAYNFLEDVGSREWDVFDADGRFQGVVTMPPRFTPRLFVRDHIFGVARDDLDVQYLVRLRIDRRDD